MNGIRTFRPLRGASAAVIVGCGIAAWVVGCGDDGPSGPPMPDPTLVAQGKDIFRFDTYGDETFWTDTLRMHEVIQAAVDPTTALAVGLKVDADALPRRCRAGYPERRDQPDRPGDHGGAAQAQCGGRPQGHRRDHRRPRHPGPGRHHLRAVPLDGEQLLRRGHRLAPRRMAQLRPRPGRDHRALARPHRRPEGGLQLVGQRPVRPPLQFRRRERARRHPACLRPARREQHHLYR